MEPSITDGIVVGAVGGGAAGLVVYLVQYLHSKVVDSIEARRIFSWLKSHTSAELLEFRGQFT